MSENTNIHTAVIATNLNCSFFMQEQNALMIDGAEEATVKPFDNYVFSQLRGLNPEVKEVNFSDIDDLKNKTRAEYKKSEALSLSLELMDPKLSINYRQKAANFLLDWVLESSDLLLYICNRVYSTILPTEFKPELALEILDSSFPSSLKELYIGLPEKSRLFSQFYTLIKINLNETLDHQHLLDYDLSETGIYAQFTRALANKDLVLYNIATSAALEYFATNKIPVESDIFDKIRLQLQDNYSIKLELSKVFESELGEFSGSSNTQKKRLKIFIGEDDKFFASMIRRALESNLNIELVDKDAIRSDLTTLIKNSAFDLILLDVNMHSTIGSDLISIFRDDFDNANRYIFFSGHRIESSFKYPVPVNNMHYFPRVSPFEGIVERITRRFPFALKRPKLI
jgi:hypothetical protein